MFDKEYYQKVFEVDKDLEFVRTDNIEYDLDKPFEKYYDVNILLLAIDKYKSGEIDAKYLAHWANAYNWIINGGFKNYGIATQLKGFIAYKITDWIDSLSFFNECKEFNDIDVYVEVFNTLDRVYHDLDNCKVVCAYEYDDDLDEYEDAPAIVLVINEKEKYYVKIFEHLEDDNEFLSIDLDELKAKIEVLKQKGYSQLPIAIAEWI